MFNQRSKESIRERDLLLVPIIRPIQPGSTQLRQQLRPSCSNGCFSIVETMEKLFAFFANSTHRRLDQLNRSHQENIGYALECESRRAESRQDSILRCDTRSRRAHRRKRDCKYQVRRNPPFEFDAILFIPVLLVLLVSPS